MVYNVTTYNSDVDFIENKIKNLNEKKNQLIDINYTKNGKSYKYKNVYNFYQTNNAELIELLNREKIIFASQSIVTVILTILTIKSI
jgi:hypothetical protein